MADNKENEIDLFHLLTVVWSKRKVIVLWGITGLIIGIIIAFSTPKEYETKITIAPESTQQSSQMNGLGAIAGFMGVGVGGSMAEGINQAVYPEIIKSTPFILEFAEITVLYNDELITIGDYVLKEQKRPFWTYILNAPGDLIGWISSIGRHKTDTLSIRNYEPMRQAFVNSLASMLVIEPSKSKGVYDVKTLMQDPLVSYVIADSLLVKLQKYMIQYRTSKARHNLTMSEQLLEQAKQKYYSDDQLYAEALDRNQNLTSKSAQAKLGKLRDERDISFHVYKQLASQVEMDKIKHQEETPIATVIEPAKLPLNPIKPRKMMISIAFCFLGGFCMVGWIVVKELLFKWRGN